MGNSSSSWCFMFVCRERDLHPVRRRQVVPMRGRARALVDPRGVPRPATADPMPTPGLKRRRVGTVLRPALGRHPLNKRRSMMDRYFDMAVRGEVVD
jgi:hypothetical protein